MVDVAASAITKYWEEVSAGDIASQTVLTVYEGWSIKRLAAFFAKHGLSGAPVVASDHSLVGVVTQTDVIKFESQTPSDTDIQKILQHYYGPSSHGMTESDVQHMKDKAIETCTVFGIMTPEVVSVDYGASVLQACQLMVEKDIHRLFVTREGKIAGALTAKDVVRNLLTSAP